MRKIRCSVYSPKNMKKLLCQVSKKDGCCFWEMECHTVAQAGDGESDVLSAGPGWPLRPCCESALPARLGGQLACRAVQPGVVFLSRNCSCAVSSPSRGRWGMRSSAGVSAMVTGRPPMRRLPLSPFSINFIYSWLNPRPPPTCPR